VVMLRYDGVVHQAPMKSCYLIVITVAGGIVTAGYGAAEERELDRLAKDPSAAVGAYRDCVYHEARQIVDRTEDTNLIVDIELEECGHYRAPIQAAFIQLYLDQGFNGLQAFQGGVEAAETTKTSLAQKIKIEAQKYHLGVESDVFGTRQ